MSAALGAGLLAGYGVALPIGAVGTYLVGLGARERLSVATSAALGVATTDGLYALVAAFGGVGLRHVLRPVQRPLTLVSIAVLVGLALHTLHAAGRRYRQEPGVAAVAVPPVSRVRAFLALLALTAVNPATVVYFSALVLGDRSATISATTTAGLLFAAGVLTASASWQLVLVCSGMTLGRVVAGRRGRLVVAVVSGGVMLALAARLALV